MTAKRLFSKSGLDNHGLANLRKVHWNHNTPMLYAYDKQTGERVGGIEIPGVTRYGMSSWVHDGHQYVIVQLANGLAAVAMPGAAPGGDGH